MTHDSEKQESGRRPIDRARHRRRIEDVITFGAPVPLLVVALTHYTDDDGHVVMLRDTLWGQAIMGLLVVVLGVVFVARVRRLRRAVRDSQAGGPPTGEGT